jgi:hypothetical protein
MDKMEARRKLKGLQLLVHNRSESELERIFDDAIAYIERERPKKRRLTGSRDRQEMSGRDRGVK